MVDQVKALLDEGIHDPDHIFRIIYPTSRRHYSTVRKAIHIAKTS